jgi:hypothetical protein
MVAITDYLTELIYAAVGALLGYLLMKMDDVLNNKQYTYKEYSKFTLGCYLATLAGLLLMRFAGPVQLPGLGSASYDSTLIAPRPVITNQLSTSTHPASFGAKPPSIPSSGTAFFQPANGSQTLRFASGTPTF